MHNAIQGIPGKLRRMARSESGSTLVLAALAMVLLLCATALVVDGGAVYAHRSHLQKIANAAVLSGAQELTHKESAVSDVVRSVLEHHGEKDSLIDLSIQMGDNVRVTLRKEVPLAFSRLLGYAAVPVEADAAAELAPMGAAYGAAPLGIEESVELEYYTIYKLKVDQSEVDTGHFGIFALGGPGANTYEYNLMYGYKGLLSIGDVMETQTGNITDKTRSSVKYRIDNCPYLPGETQHRDCSRVILVPVFKPHKTTGNQLKEVKITGFAYFYLTEPMDDKDKTISGMFIRRAGTGIAAPEAPDKGAYVIRLTK